MQKICGGERKKLKLKTARMKQNILEIDGMVEIKGVDGMFILKH